MSPAHLLADLFAVPVASVSEAAPAVLAEQLGVILHTLPPREAWCLTRRYGLDGVPPATYRIMAQSQALSVERMRQLTRRAFRRCRHPSRRDRLRFWVEPSGIWHWDPALGWVPATGPLGPLADDTPLNTLEWSVRARNCLARAHIDTLGDLCQRSERDLLTIKNLGWRTLREIKHVVACHDRSLAEMDARGR